MVVLGARREVTGVALLVALGIAAVGIAIAALSPGELYLLERLGRYFPEGPWRDAGRVLGWVGVAALTLTTVEAVAFRIRPRGLLEAMDVSQKSLEQTLDEVRRRLAECTQTSDPDIARALDVLLRGAMVLSASDIHMSPSKSGQKVTYRVDGVIHQVLSVPPELAHRITSRVKILARLEGHSRRPQDGVLRRKVGEFEIEARVSALPANYGERVVLRLVRGGSCRDLLELGLGPKTVEQLAAILARPQGLLLVSGPVGSGKTTTLYSCLQHLYETRRDTTALVSLEDPIEVQLPFVTQTQMNPKAGMTFAQTLRSVLRQDPGALMVGEIRDRETAEIAAQAGLTGHLILSTLHVNSAAGTFARLTEMGVEPYVLSSACVGSLAQRLVRSLCVACRLPQQPDDALLARLFALGATLPQGDFFQPVGCELCEGRGYLGRLPIAELLLVTESIMTAIRERQSTEAIHRLAEAEGMETLLQSGLAAAAAGRTSLEEVLRVAG